MDRKTTQNSYQAGEIARVGVTFRVLFQGVFGGSPGFQVAREVNHTVFLV